MFALVDSLYVFDVLSSGDRPILCPRSPQTGRRTSRAEIEPPCRPDRTSNLHLVTQSHSLQGIFSAVSSQSSRYILTCVMSHSLQGLFLLPMSALVWFSSPICLSLCLSRSWDPSDWRFLMYDGSWFMLFERTQQRIVAQCWWLMVENDDAKALLLSSWYQYCQVSYLEMVRFLKCLQGIFSPVSCLTVFKVCPCYPHRLCRSAWVRFSSPSVCLFAVA